MGEIEWVERLGGGEVWTESTIRKVPRKGVEGLEILEGCVQKARKVRFFKKKKKYHWTRESKIWYNMRVQSEECRCGVLKSETRKVGWPVWLTVKIN